MSLLEMDTERTDELPSDQLKNAVEAYIVSGLQAADWEPIGRTGGKQMIGKGKRAFMVEVTMLDEVHRG